MSERSCAGATAFFSRAPTFDATNWRDAAKAAVAGGRNWAQAALCRPRRPRADKAALAFAGLNDHTLADIGIHRSQIPALARRVAERPDADPRGDAS